MDVSPQAPPSHMRTTRRMVGRRRPLRWLRAGLQEARNGKPRFLLLEGEAGIGKTRLAREIAGEAHATGCLVLEARCDERRPEPYGPLIDSLFPLLRNVERSGPLSPRTDAALRALLGQHDTQHNPIDEILDDPGAATRYDTRLLLDLTDLTIGLTQARHLLLLVDDLAWADPSTFRFVMRLVLRAADLSRRSAVPLLLVVTTRPELEEVRRVELERVLREEIASRIDLQGLDLPETAELLRELGVPQVTPSLAEQAHRATTGNPLFIETVARRLMDTHGAESHAGSAFSEIPLEIRAAVDESLEPLSRDCRAVLRIASVLGRAADIASVAQLSQLDTARLEDAIEEARRYGVAAVQDDTIVFRHPLYRAALYQSIQPGRRRHLHASVAKGLASVVTPAALAEHLIAAGPEVAPAQVGRCCQAAAEEAAALFAWREAARFYRAAVAAEDRAPGVFDPDAFAHLLQAAGVACDLAMDATSADRFLARAIGEFERRDDVRGLVQTALARARCLVAHRNEHDDPVGSFRDGVEVLAAGLRKLHGDEELRSSALAALAELHWAQGDFGRASDVAHDAMVAGQAAGSSDGLVRSQLVLGLSAMIQLDLRGSLERIDAARREALRGGEQRLVAEGSIRQPLLAFWLGRLAEAEASALEAEALVRRVNDPLLLVMPLAARVSAAVARGDLASADECAYEAVLLERLTGYTWVNGMFLPALASLQVRRGDFSGARRTLDLASESSTGGWRQSHIARWFGELYLDARLGDLERVRTEIARKPQRVALEPVPFLGPAAWAGALVEIADLLDRPELAAGPARLLGDTLARGQVFSAGLQFYLPRSLGMAERLAGDVPRAIARLRAAVADTAACGAWVEHALSLRELARALAVGDSAERARADSVSRAARDALVGLGLEAEVPALDRPSVARGARESSERTASEATEQLTILFTDIEGSTPLVERLGDASALELLRNHDQIVRRQLAAWRGWEVDQEGDSFFAAFSSIEDALRCAAGIQRELSALPLGETIRLRIGVHTGEVLRQGTRLFGLNVIVASRIAASARAGEVLVSSATRVALGAAVPLRFGPMREVELKGLTRKFDLAPLLWAERSSGVHSV